MEVFYDVEDLKRYRTRKRKQREYAMRFNCAGIARLRGSRQARWLSRC
jgi:hypothetical protein